MKLDPPMETATKLLALVKLEAANVAVVGVATEEVVMMTNVGPECGF
jgi:hypothetical protein